jgi:hypothetical protein
LPDGHPQNEKSAIAVPSLGGEGQDEGGCKTTIYFAGAEAGLRAAGVVPAVSHRRMQQLRVQKAACWNKFPRLE